MQRDKPTVTAPLLKYRLFFVLYDSVLFKRNSASPVPGKDNGKGRRDMLINTRISISIPVCTLSVLVTVHSLPTAILNLRPESKGFVHVTGTARLSKGSSLGHLLVSGRKII
jgi:hypothetical protein